MIWSQAHAEAIDGQLAVFEAELKRMEETGEGGAPITTDPALGTLRHVSPWRSGLGPSG